MLLLDIQFDLQTSEIYVSEVQTIFLAVVTSLSYRDSCKQLGVLEIFLRFRLVSLGKQPLGLKFKQYSHVPCVFVFRFDDHVC
ncbi:MAG: hypothetical protein EZS28_034383 [Streblomastix strix]|uniref:Uncharacterized protein n=1 Tax=Streblomastix strix TaxID=222440 RepID=A0A5J4UJC6_9EUKA|nr:MAG: hypothetical protein EZS28_034383 [Streblomastix strix]